MRAIWCARPSAGAESESALTFDFLPQRSMFAGGMGLTPVSQANASFPRRRFGVHRPKLRCQACAEATPPFILPSAGRVTTALHAAALHFADPESA